MAQEEIFGPVVCAVPFETEEEAIAIAIDIPYGLGCSIWTKDVARAHRVARDVEAGVIWINVTGFIQAFHGAVSRTAGTAERGDSTSSTNTQPLSMSAYGWKPRGPTGMLPKAPGNA